MYNFKFFKKIKSDYMISIIDEKNNEKNISIAMIEKKFGIEWVEYSDDNINMYQKLQIRYMGEILGWGLFAKKDIKANETIGVFTGKIYFQERTKKITSKHIFLSDAPENQFQVVDASEYGNITRFIQHLPTEDIVRQIKFKKENIRDEVATSNIKHRLLELEKGIITEHYSALKSIKAGEILGSNYGAQFWLEKTPLLLRKDGTILNAEYYSYPSQIPIIKNYTCDIKM